MRQCKSTEDCTACRCQPDPDFALVPDPGSSRYSACDLKTVYQFHCTVMLDEKPGGNFANRGFGSCGKTLHGKQQLMLLRLDSVLFCRCLAEMKELPNLAPEFGQVPVLVLRKISICVHKCIVSRYALASAP